MADGCNECGGLRESLDAIRDDVNQKHQQNRGSIHQLRNDIQKNALIVSALAGKIAPYLDNGQPGVITKMSDKLDELKELVTSFLIRQASDAGEKSLRHRWAEHLWAPLIVGILLVLAAHYWK